jgi:hypothetical protein
MPAVENSPAHSRHPALSGIVRRLIEVAEAQEQLLALLADAVKRGDRDEVFRTASALVGPDISSAETCRNSPR